MEEKYGIELELLTDAFNKKINQIKNYFSGIKNQEINVKANTAQLSYIESQINDITDKIRRIDTGFETGDVLKLEAQLEKLRQQYQKLSEVEDEVGFKGTTAFNNMQKGINKVTSKMKRFAFSLFSIRSIYSLLSRASSAYMSQDTALANKLQAVWIGLGAILEPVISAIANTLIKAVKYINIFIKALTGVDLLAKATAKSMGKTTKGAKALSKALAGFDELNNLDTNADGGSSGIDTSWADAFNKVELDTEWIDKIKSFGEWMKINWPEVIGFFIGTKTAISLIKLGLDGIKAIGIGTMIFGIIYTVKSLIDYLKDPSFENFGKIIQGIGITVMGLGMAFLGLPVVIAGAIVLAIGTIIKFWDDIKAFFQGGIDWLVNKSDFIHEKFGDTIGGIYDTFVECLQGILDWFDLMFNSIKNIFDGIIKVVKGVFTGDWKLALEGAKQIFSNAWNFIYSSFSMFGDFIWRRVIQPAINNFKYLKDNVINLFRNIGSKVGEVIGSAFKNVINGVLRAIENILNAPIRAINNLINVINAVPGINIGKLNTFRLPRLNVGTNYVPQDQLAYIHKGEAVIPKKFNSQEYFGNGNEKTNSLLETLIEKVDNIEINPYTTIKDVGQASLQFKRDRQRQTGVNVFA